MARNIKRTLEDLEENHKFNFVFNKKIRSGFKFIRFGNKQMAIDKKKVKDKIKAFDSNQYAKLMAGEINEWDIKCDFWYYPDGCISQHLPGLSTFTGRNEMPDCFKDKPERLWQLDPENPFPDELDIIVHPDRTFKGYIKPKSHILVKKDNFIEMLSCLPWKKCPIEPNR